MEAVLGSVEVLGVLLQQQPQIDEHLHVLSILHHINLSISFLCSCTRDLGLKRYEGNLEEGLAVHGLCASHVLAPVLKQDAIVEEHAPVLRIER